jgi:hypothetical protein
MEFLALSSTELASTAGIIPYVMLLVGGLVKYKLNKRRMSRLTAFIIPPNSDRNAMIEKFRSHSGFKNVYFYYPEDHVIKGSTLKVAEKNELKKLRLEDAISWENKMMPYVKTQMDEFVGVIKVSPKRMNIVVLSSPNIAKFLSIKNVYSFIGSNRLNKETIETKGRQDSTLIHYIRSQFTKEKSIFFQDADELFDLVELQLEDISKKTSKKI